MASSGTSKYGLIIPKKSTKGPVLKPAAANIFGDDSDEESGTSAVNQTVKKESARAKIKKQTQLEIDKALQEDPSVYEYDSIYDNIQAQKVGTDVKEAHKVDKKPKYIAGLMKMAEVRKREEERRVERKVQKEREEEGDLYSDKEAFVTSAYKKKMLEQQAEAERERREAAMEEMLDVTKQKDLSGFYRYLYRETTGTGLAETQDAEIKEESRVKVKEEPHSDADGDDAASAREKKPHTTKDSRPTPHRSRRDSDDDKSAPKHRSPTEKSKANGSSRQRSRSREKEHQRHRHRRSRSSSPAHGRGDKHRHRSRSRDRKRDRSSSRDRTRRSRPEPGRSDEEGSSRKEQKRRHGSREERSPSAGRKETSAKISSPPADRSPSPEMLPARPPDEDLDRDDSASESASSSDEASAGKREGQGQGEGDSASKGRKREGVSGNRKDVKEEEPKVKYARKTTDKEMLDARQRFLARKLAKERARPVVEPE